jgi:hypothetical protein
MNKDIKESANIKPGPSKETLLLYYKELWTSNSLHENYSNAENVDGIITIKELKEAQKKIKNKNHLTEVT